MIHYLHLIYDCTLLFSLSDVKLDKFERKNATFRGFKVKPTHQKCHFAINYETTLSSLAARYERSTVTENWYLILVI